jgi:hypothetical protein
MLTLIQRSHCRQPIVRAVADHASSFARCSAADSPVTSGRNGAWRFVFHIAEDLSVPLWAPHLSHGRRSLGRIAADPPVAPRASAIRHRSIASGSSVVAAFARCTGSGASGPIRHLRCPDWHIGSPPHCRPSQNLRGGHEAKSWSVASSA